jgi:predicted AAA+ superfamily ATPase
VFARKSLETLKQWYLSKKRKPLVLRGARQVGKTFLVKQLAQAMNLQLIEINFELQSLRSLGSPVIEMRDLLTEIELKVGRRLEPKNDLIFFDEIQKCPQALVALRYFYELHPQLAVVAAGSLLDFLFHDQAISVPVGRIEFHFLGPFTFSEYLAAKNKHLLVEEFRKPAEQMGVDAHDLLMKEWNSFLITGGMPECVQAEVDGGDLFEIRKIQKNLFNTYKADILKYSKGTQIIRCETVFDYVPGHIGQKVKYSEVDPDERAINLKAAIQLLIYARIILPVYHSNATSLPLKSVADERIYKLFHLDVGLVSAGLQIDSFLDANSPSFGPMSEQFVAQHLAYLDPSDDPKLFYWLKDKSAVKAEVDFVYSYGGQVVPIEVKSSRSAKSRSLSEFVNQIGATKTTIKFSPGNYREKKLGDIRQVECPIYLVERINEIIGLK